MSYAMSHTGKYKIRANTHINNDAIESRRKQLGYTQKELAEKLGYKSVSSINKKLYGEVQWTETDIKNLKYYLGLTDSQLKYKE
jgi:transcriptional regulator with XRE-family HTH domain